MFLLSLMYTKFAVNYAFNLILTFLLKLKQTPFAVVHAFNLTLLVFLIVIN